MRAFVEIRQAAANYEQLEKRLAELERNAAGKFGKHERQLAVLFKAMRELAATPPSKPKHPIGFSPPKPEITEGVP